MENSTAAIVVTFNRENELLVCLKAVLKQESLPSRLYIIDNQSNSKTYEMLFENDFINQKPDEKCQEDQFFSHNIKLGNQSGPEFLITYVRKAKNDGGAGGFYTGMKKAYDDGCDWLWLMDDDGVPDKFQLLELKKNVIENNILYSNALVTDITDSSRLAFGLGGFDLVSEVNKNVILPNYVNPFNGTLISRQVIDKIGFIKREMFIWGDETEYTNRVKKAGFSIATITTALHRHPFMRGKMEYVIPLLLKTKIVVKPEHFSKYYYRNLGFNMSQYANPKACRVLYLLYVTYFITRLRFSELKKFEIYFKEGMQDKFERV